MNQRTMDDENITKDLPWYQDVYNYVRSPEFRKFDAGELGQSFKGNIKQLGSWYNDMVGLGYNALDPGGIIPGVGTDDPNFGLIDFFKNMMTQKREGSFGPISMSEIDKHPDFFKYTQNLHLSQINEKRREMDTRLDEILAQAGLNWESIPQEIIANAANSQDGVKAFYDHVMSYEMMGGQALDLDTKMELDNLLGNYMTLKNNPVQFEDEHGILKMDKVFNTDGSMDRENSMVTFGNMPKVDEGPFGLDMILDPGYSGDTLNLTNLGKYAMRDGELARVQPSIQNWLSDWNVNPDRMGGILQSVPGYEALGDFLEDKWVKNVAWQGHDFDFPEGIETDKEKEGFLLQMYPLMAMGVGAPVSKLLSSPAGKVATGTGGTTLAAAPETKDDLEITLNLPYGEQ